MKKRGFTLIELLAVIVILAVIAFIATPTILGMIERSRKKAAESSMLNYVDEIERELLAEVMEESNFIPQGMYRLENKMLKKDSKEIALEIKGDTPKEDVGNIIEVNTNGEVSSANMKFGNYYVHYELKDNRAIYCSNKEEFKTCDGDKIEQIVLVFHKDLPSTMTKGDNYSILQDAVEGSSCISSIDGKVENTKDLSEGKHTITCTANKAIDISRQIEVTYQAYTAKNIVKNGSFEDGTNYWVDGYNGILEVTTEQHYYGNHSLKLTPQDFTQLETYVYQATTENKADKVNLENGNKYYCQLYIMSNISSVSMSLHTDNWQEEEGNYVMGSGASNEWKRLSLYIDKKLPKNNEYYIRLDNDNNKQETTSYFDGYVCINLTETFGSGREPNKTWCDKHISWFDGTTTIYK